MSISSFTSASLKSLAKLLDKKESFVAEIQKIEAEIASVLTGKPTKAPGKRSGRPAKKGVVAKESATAKKAPKKRAARGSIGAKIQKALEDAGDAGVKVTELAKALKVKSGNLHVWFATTGKKNPAIKKAGKGHYKLAKNK